jgi:hypothetical protein
MRQQVMQMKQPIAGLPRHQAHHITIELLYLNSSSNSSSITTHALICTVLRLFGSNGMLKQQHQLHAPISAQTPK